MLKNNEYSILSRFGSGTWQSLSDIYSLATHGRSRIKLTREEFKQIIHKFLCYGLLQRKEYNTQAFSYAARLCLSHKGSDALEHYKKFRYSGTHRRYVVTKEQNFKFKNNLQKERWI